MIQKLFVITEKLNDMAGSDIMKYNWSLTFILMKTCFLLDLRVTNQFVKKNDSCDSDSESMQC